MKINIIFSCVHVLACKLLKHQKVMNEIFLNIFISINSPYNIKKYFTLVGKVKCIPHVQGTSLNFPNVLQSLNFHNLFKRHLNWVFLRLFKSRNKCIKRNHLFWLLYFDFSSSSLSLSLSPSILTRSVCVWQALLNIRKVFTMPAWMRSTACPSPRCWTNSFCAYTAASRPRFSHSTTSRR